MKVNPVLKTWEEKESCYVPVFKSYLTQQRKCNDRSGIKPSVPAFQYFMRCQKSRTKPNIWIPVNILHQIINIFMRSDQELKLIGKGSFEIFTLVTSIKNNLQGRAYLYEQPK